MAIIQKSSFPLNLEVYPVFINDTLDSSRYFKVTQLPDAFTGGKNAFLIQGATELKEDSYIFVEVKDARGNIIYSEPAGGSPSQYYEGVSKPIAVHIYPDTAYGPCTITIVGELKEYQENGIFRPIPNEWTDRINVRWQKKINVYPLLANTTPIRFYKRPAITITEEFLPIYSRASSFIPLTGWLRGDAISPGPLTKYPYQGPITYQIRSIDPATEYLNQDLNTTPPSIATITPFTNALIGQPIAVTNIYDSVGTISNPTTWTARILSLTNPYTAIVEIPYVQLFGQKQLINNIGFAQWDSSYETSSVVASNLSSSYATIKVSNLDTFSGDPYRLKTFVKSRNDTKGFSVLEDIVIESKEFFEETFFNGELRKKTGIFDNQTILDFFWTGSNLDTSVSQSITQIGNLSSAAVRLTPGTEIPNSNGLFKFLYYSGSTDSPLVVSKDTEYQLYFNASFISSSLGNTGVVDVYVTGSAFANTDSTLRYGKKIGSLNGSGFNQTFLNQRINFKPDYDGSGSLSFNVRGGIWELTDLSLQPSKQSSFTPNEISFLTKPNIQIASESFDFRFELFDINYTYVPVTLESTVRFAGGNDILPAFRISTSDNGKFTLSADGTIVTPNYIDINVQKVVYTDPIQFSSSSLQPGSGLRGAYSIIVGEHPTDPQIAVSPDRNVRDEFYDINNGYNYPGLLTVISPENTYRLYWADFSSSLRDNTRGVSEIKYYSWLGASAIPTVGPNTTFQIVADYNVVTTTTTLPPGQPISFASGSTAAEACTASPLVYYMESGCRSSLSLGCRIYTNPAMTTYVFNLWYAYGANSYRTVNGEIVEISNVCTTTTTTTSTTTTTTTAGITSNPKLVLKNDNTVANQSLFISGAWYRETASIGNPTPALIQLSLSDNNGLVNYPIYSLGYHTANPTSPYIGSRNLIQGEYDVIIHTIGPKIDTNYGADDLILYLNNNGTFTTISPSVSTFTTSPTGRKAFYEFNDIPFLPNTGNVTASFSYNIASAPLPPTPTYSFAYLAFRYACSSPTIAIDQVSITFADPFIPTFGKYYVPFGGGNTFAYRVTGNGGTMSGAATGDQYSESTSAPNACVYTGTGGITII